MITNQNVLLKAILLAVIVISAMLCFFFLGVAKAYSIDVGEFTDKYGSGLLMKSIKYPQAEVRQFNLVANDGTGYHCITMANNNGLAMWCENTTDKEV